MNFELFKTWLEDGGYSTSTKRQSLQKIDYAWRAWSAGEKMPPSAKKGVQRYLHYVKETGDRSRFSEALTASLAALKNEVTRYGPRKPKSRKREARSIDDTSWRELAHAVAESPADEARVLEVMLATGMRIGDVLRVTESSIKSALRTGYLVTEIKGQREVSMPIGGSQDAWEHMYRAMYNDRASQRDRRRQWENVAEWICPTGNASALAGDCAYARVHRKLKSICTSCSLTERIHLHRIRRTVAVQALRITEDVRVVKDLLGHSSLKSTSAYLDEARPEAVIDIQKKLRARFQ